MGLIPGQGTCLGSEFSPTWGMQGEDKTNKNPPISVSQTQFVSSTPDGKN